MHPRTSGQRSHPFFLRPDARSVLLEVDAAVGLAHGDRPVVGPAHHDPLDEGLAADVGLARAVLRKRTRQIARLPPAFARDLLDAARAFAGRALGRLGKTEEARSQPGSSQPSKTSESSSLETLRHA